MAKFAEAEARLFKNRFVCRKCKTVMKASSLAISEGKVKCKSCYSKSLRPKRKK